MEEESDIEDCYPEKVLDNTQSGLLKSAVSFDRECPQNIITFRKAPSWQSDCATTSYVEIAFRSMRLDQQRSRRNFGKCNHAAVHNTTDDSLLGSSSTCSRTPSQNSYFDFKTIPYTSAAVSESQQKFENAVIDSFLDQEHRNFRFSANNYDGNNKISRNLIALDLSPARLSLKRALRESVKINSSGDFQTTIDHLEAFSNVPASRNRAFGVNKNAAGLRRSSFQSASWHCLCNPKKHEQNCNLFRILLGSDLDWVRDPHRNTSYIHNNISQIGEILESEIPYETFMSESILQDSQSQQTKNGYLQKLVDLASQYFLRWKSEERLKEDPSAAQGNSSLATEESLNLSFHTNQGSNSDTAENSEPNTQNSRELQSLGPDHNPPGSLGKWKESIQVVAGKANIFKILRRQFGGWRVSRVVAQEKHPHFYEIDLGSNTLFTGEQELALTIQNGTAPQLTGFEEINAKCNNEFYTGENEQDMNHEQNGENLSLDSQDFKHEMSTKHYTSECKDQKVKRQGYGIKFAISETRGRQEKALKRMTERGNRSSRIDLTESTRKQKHWYMRKSKLKRKMLTASDEMKSTVVAGVGDGEEQESEVEEEAMTRESDVEEEAMTRERAGSEDKESEYDYGDDADDDEDEEEGEEKYDEEMGEEEEKEEEKQQQQQQQHNGQPVRTENVSSDSSDCASEDYSDLKLHKTNVKKWRANVADWKQKREKVLLSCLPKDGYKSEQTGVARLGEVPTNNEEKSIKSARTNSDSESTEIDSEEMSERTNIKRNFTRKENICRDVQKVKAQERKISKYKENVSLCRGDEGEYVSDCEKHSSEDCEKHSSECEQCIEYYSNHSTWKSLATNIRKRHSSLFRYRIKPQMSDHKDSAVLLNRLRELERIRISEYLKRFHIARKSFFVNYDMEFKETWTERTRDKWLQEKYRSSAEEQKLLQSNQTADGDTSKEKHNFLKEVFMKMDEIASGDNRNENDRDAMSLDKWVSLLDTLIKVNEKVGDDSEATNKKRRQRNIAKKQTHQLQIRDYVHNRRGEIPELGKRRDFNLNKEIFDWMVDSQSVEVNNRGGHTHQRRESTEMKKIQRRIAYAEHSKSDLGGQGRGTLTDLDETRKKQVLAEITSDKKKTECSRNLYQMLMNKEVGAKCHTIMKEENRITKKIQNGQQNTNNDTVEEKEKYVDLKSEKNKEVTNALEDIDKYEQKENEIESSARNEVLETVAKEEAPINELKDDDKQVDKINPHPKKEKKNNHGADNRNNKRESLLPATDKSRDKEGALDKPNIESSRKEDSDGSIGSRDNEIEVSDSEKINVVYSLEKDGDVEKRVNIAGPSGDETMKEITSGENVKVQDPNQGVEEPERQQLDHWTNPDAKLSLDKPGTDSLYTRTLVPISEKGSEVESYVSEEDPRSGQLIESTEVIPEETLPSGRKHVMAEIPLPFQGVVGFSHVNFLKQRIIEEIAKLSTRNVRPVVEIPERRTLMKPPEADPMFMSRKTLDKIDEFLGIKVSSWLVPEGATISEECSSSASSLNLQPETIDAKDKHQSTHSEEDALLDSRTPMLIRNPDFDNFVENSRELTFYQPSLPIPPHYKCSCFDCKKISRSGKHPSRRMRSRRTLLSADNFRCKVARYRSHPETRFNQDAWANSDLERSSHIKPNKRIYCDRLFKRRISVKNILKLCSKYPGWYHPMISSGMLNISAQDCNEHDKQCVAMCLHAGDFKNQPKADLDYSHSDPAGEGRHLDKKEDLDMPNDCTALDSYLNGFAPSSLPENTYKSDSFPNHKYNSCKPFDYLENARGYTRSSPYTSPLSQLPASVNPQCNLNTTGDSFDHSHMLNFYNSTKYITAGHTMPWPVYRLPSTGCPLTSYLSENCYSSRRLSPVSYHCRSCPSGLTPDICYSSPLLTRYTHPTTSWRPTVSASNLYTYKASNPRRPASIKYCSGCQVSSSSPFINYAGTLNFSIHDYV